MAVVDRFIKNLNDYVDKIRNITKMLKEQEFIKPDYEIDLNTADSYENESVYLAVTGTSAQHGDDGSGCR